MVEHSSQGSAIAGLRSLDAGDLAAVHGGGTAHLAWDVADGRRLCAEEGRRQQHFAGEAQKALPENAWQTGVTLTPDQARTLQHALNFGASATSICSAALGIEVPR